MARWGSVDYRELEQLQQQLEAAAEQEAIDQFCQKCAKEIAARLLRKVIKRTPVGIYPTESGKMGGTLRRGWKVKGGRINTDSVRTNNIAVEKQGRDYVVTIFNDTPYASYVEYGHRQEPGRFVPAIGKRLKKGWVDGKFMLTISESEIQSIAPALLEKRLKQYMQEVFGT